MSLFRATVTVGGWTAVSRLLGLVRDIMISGALGTSAVGDAYFAAAKFPNFFRRLFAEGAFNSAFVPMFAGHLEDQGKGPALAFAEQVLALLLAVLVLFTAMAELTMPWLIYGIAPGFDDAVRYPLAVALTRITFPYLLCMSLASLFSGVLNSLGRFGASSATSVLFNLVTIVTLVVLTPFVPTAGHALAWGILLSGIVQVVWLGWSLRGAGAELWLRRPRLTPEVGRMLRVMLWGAYGAGVVQISVQVDTLLASLLPEGSVSFLYFADRLWQLPLGVVGTAVGTALLPLLSRQLRAGQTEAALHSQNRGLEMALALTIPAAVGLVVLAEPITALLFQHGEFDAASSIGSAGAVAGFSIGLPATVLIKVLTPAFFARQDTRTPVRIATVTLAINIALSVALMQVMAHVGIALATGLSAWANAGLLAAILHRRRLFRADRQLRRRVAGMVAATAGMALALLVGRHVLAPWILAAGAHRAAAVALLIGGGVAVFFAAAQLAGGLDLRELVALMRRRRAPA